MNVHTEPATRHHGPVSGTTPRYGDWKADTSMCPGNCGSVRRRVLAMLLRLAVGICGGERLAIGGQRLTDSALLASLHERVNRLGVKLHRLWQLANESPFRSSSVSSAPVILLPASLLWSGAEDVETILAHELAHLRRRDHLTIVVQRGLEAVLFTTTPSHGVGRQVDTFREDACDDLDSRQRHRPSRLRDGLLLRVAELRTSTAEKQQQLAVDGEHPSKMRRRIERIVESKSDPGVRCKVDRASPCSPHVAAALAFLVQLPVRSQIASREVATSRRCRRQNP